MGLDAGSARAGLSGAGIANRNLAVAAIPAAFAGFLAGIAVARAGRRAAEREAVNRERRRIARELHDGAAQEIAFAVGQTRMLAGADPRAERAARASERAMQECRAAISDLRHDPDEPLDAALTRAAREAARGGPAVEVRVAPGARVEPEARHELLRILREAVGNASRHARASAISVSLENGVGTSLLVTDDGRGFDAAQAERRSDRFGLVGMRERARELGGELTIRSAPGEGTTIELRIP